MKRGAVYAQQYDAEYKRQVVDPSKEEVRKLDAFIFAQLKRVLRHENDDNILLANGKVYVKRKK